MAQRLVMTDEPNLVIPLAASFNTRGIAGFTNFVTNALDQRKSNCLYKPITNAMTGNRTIYLCKRPGVDNLSGTYGVSTQTAFLWEVQAGATANTSTNYVVFANRATTTNAITSVSTTLVTSIAGYFPTFVDKTHLSGAENLVLQLRHTSNFAQLVFFTTSGAYTQITDGDFPNPKGKLEFLDGYTFAMTSTNTIANSDLNSLANWTATNFIRKQITQDIPRALGKLGNQIIGWGAGTMEVFRNAGLASGSPLETIPQLASRHGITNIDTANMQHYYAELGGRVYWLGDGPTCVWAYDGSRVEKVSTPAIEAILREGGITAVNPVDCGGQRAVAFAVNNRTAGNQFSLLFFPEWNEWFDWNSTVFQPVTSARVPNVFIGASSNANRLYGLSQTAENYMDDDTAFTMFIRFKLPTPSGNQRKVLHMCGVVGDSAPTTTTSLLSVRFTTDDWQTSTAARTINMTNRKKHLYRNGAFRDIGVYLAHDGNVDVRLEKFIARIE